MENANPSISLADALGQVSLTAANIGNSTCFEPVLEDWLAFLGGRPAEITVVDGGSSPETHAVYWKLFNEKKIDKLQVIRKEHSDNHRDTCYIQEYIVGAIASKPYILFFKSDTLPYRQGHELWLPEAIEYLQREDTFAVGGSFNLPSHHHDAWPGWYFSHKCSLNFALMKRSSFMEAMEETAGEFIRSGYRREKNPIVEGNKRYVVETSFERYMARHKKFTLVKIEDPTWTVFHTNIVGKQLVGVREKYLQRVDVERYMNARIQNRYWGGCYYGRPPMRWKNFKWAVGESPLGALIRAVKRSVGIGSAAS
jgi:hypothetical protein